MQRYNVVLVISDQHRRDACGCYGNRVVKTPGIDRAAERGTTFTAGYCDSPLCAPSRASVITGMMPHSHKALTHMMNGKNPGTPGNPGIVCTETMGTMFRNAGYQTAAVGKMHVHGETREEDLGFSFRKHRYYTYSFEDYRNEVGEERVKAYLSRIREDDHFRYNMANAPVQLEERHMQDSLTTSTTLQFIRDHKDEPFFVHMGLEKPHPPWTTQPRFHDMYDPSQMPLPATRRQWEEQDGNPYVTGRGLKFSPTDEEMQGAVAAYYACITDMDHNLSRVIDEIESLGLTKRTIFIYTSDHGENLFDHGLCQKHCFYEPSVAVPLVMSCPGLLPESLRCDQPCTLIDLLPTLAELNGTAVPGEAEGISLVPAMRGRTDPDRPIFSEIHEWTSMRMVRTSQWKFIYAPGHPDQLYDVKNDLDEIENLAEDLACANVCRELKARILEGWGKE